MSCLNRGARRLPPHASLGQLGCSVAQRITNYCSAARGHPASSCSSTPAGRLCLLQHGRALAPAAASSSGACRCVTSPPAACLLPASPGLLPSSSARWVPATVALAGCCLRRPGRPATPQAHSWRGISEVGHHAVCHLNAAPCPMAHIMCSIRGACLAACVCFEQPRHLLEAPQHPAASPRVGAPGTHLAATVLRPSFQACACSLPA